VGDASYRVEGKSVGLELELTPGDGGHLPSTCEVWAPGNRRFAAEPRFLSPPDVAPGRAVYQARFPDDFDAATPLEAGKSYTVEWRGGGARRPLLGRTQFNAPRALSGEWIPHELEVVLNHAPADDFIDLEWSYPYTPHPIARKTLRVETLGRPKLKGALDQLVAGLESRIVVEDVHHPHRDLTPSSRPTRFGFYVGGSELRRAVVEYEEEVGGSNVKRRPILPADDLAADELSAWRALREEAKGIAWDSYQRHSAAT
jgi:hypothetical protein